MGKETLETSIRVPFSEGNRYYCIVNITLGYSIPDQNRQRRLGWSVGLLSFLGRWSPLKKLAIYLAKSSTKDYISIRMQLDGVLHYLKTEDVLIEEVPTSLRNVSRLLDITQEKVQDIQETSAPELIVWKDSICAASKSAKELLKYVEFLHEVEKIGTARYLESDEVLRQRVAAKNQIEIGEDQL